MKLSQKLMELAEWWAIKAPDREEDSLWDYKSTKHMSNTYGKEYWGADITLTDKSYLCLLEAEYQKDLEELDAEEMRAQIRSIF